MLFLKLKIKTTSTCTLGVTTTKVHRYLNLMHPTKELIESNLQQNCYVYVYMCV